MPHGPTCTAGHEWNNYTHDCNELVAVQEGRMRFTLLDEELFLEPGVRSLQLLL